MLSSVKAKARDLLRKKYDRLMTRRKEVRWFVRDPARAAARISNGRALARQAELIVPKSKGFLPFQATAFGGTDQLVAAGRAIVARWEAEGAQLRETRKPFFQNIMQERDLIDYPAIMNFSLNRQLLATLSAYYGFVPEICSLGLMVSTPSPAPIGSQLVHFDEYDSHHVKVVVAIEDVDPENGPLEFLPADRSRAIATRLGARFSAKVRCEDSIIFKHIRRSELNAATIRAGDGLILDTSRCLHLGSRVTSGRRVMWFIHFATFSEYEKLKKTANESVLFQNFRERMQFATDPLTGLTLSV
jgi:hypothetical protein